MSPYGMLFFLVVLLLSPIAPTIVLSGIEGKYSLKYVVTRAVSWVVLIMMIAGSITLNVILYNVMPQWYGDGDDARFMVPICYLGYIVNLLLLAWSVMSTFELEFDW